MNKRKLKFDDLEISGKRYKELCGFCEQYPEWKSQLYEFMALKAVQSQCRRQYQSNSYEDKFTS